MKLTDLLRNIGPLNSTVWNLYGPAETTIACTFHRVQITLDTHLIPIGRALPNYRSMIIDKYSQSPVTNQDGELFIGGVGVFAGYFGRDDLTAKALIEIDGDLFYRTGDLVRMDDNGLLHYQGRKDHQVKVHGQRIELGEIERCLLNTSPSISACVVIKWTDDHLVAYVQSSHLMPEQQLRQHCESHLPPHMIPSFFTILEQLPLNANGKIDRKRLPPPDISHPASSNDAQLLQPSNDAEQIVHDLWCEICHRKQISIDANIFTLGGHSLLLMQLLHRYKTEFHLGTNSLSIADLFQHPTIARHAHLIQQTLHISNSHDIHHDRWSSLHLIRGNPFHALVMNSILFSFCSKSILCTRTYLLR